MTTPLDFTRWNRAGLRRFLYVGQNAATLFDALRALSAERFPQWQTVQTADDGESESDRQKGMIDRYHGKRGDWAWEIARSFARVGHVLSGYINAYANEGCLETATQWDHVRRLVAMLDYHPAPPASALTPLALIVKEGRDGTAQKGLQLKYSPPEGGPALIFETLDDLRVDDRLNAVRPRDFNRSKQTVSGGSVTLDGAVKNISVGTPVIFEQENTGHFEARLVTGVRVLENTTVLDFDRSIAPGSGFTKGHTVVHLRPADRISPVGPVVAGLDVTKPESLSDDGVETLHLKEDATGLPSETVVCIDDGRNTYYRMVTSVNGRWFTYEYPIIRLNLTTGRVGLAVPLKVVSSDKSGDTLTLKLGGDCSRLQGATITFPPITYSLAAPAGGDGKTKAPPSYYVKFAVYHPFDSGECENHGYTFLTLTSPVGDLFPVRPQEVRVPPVVFSWHTDTYLKTDDASRLESTMRIGALKKTSAGDFVAVKSGGKAYAWGRLSNSATDDAGGGSVITAPEWFHYLAGRYYLAESIVYGHFKVTARISGWDRNEALLSGSVIALEPAVAEAFEIGRRIIIHDTAFPGFTHAIETSVTAISGAALTVADSPGSDGMGFTVATTVVYGNVVSAGHGGTMSEKVLGSGDATRSFQSFVFPVEGISFIADSSQNAGVAADIVLTVDGAQWRQVATLKDSRPGDRHFNVRMTEDATLLIGFGDGVNGRRPPTGTNNIRVRYRVGTGLKGNLPCGSLARLMKPNRLIEKVIQPFNAVSGNDMEDADSLRQAAPASVLALERAVSASDFAALARRNGSVWQACAHCRQQARTRYESVEVIIVPAGGTSLTPLLREALTSYLQSHAVPFVDVSVTGFHKAPLHLDIKLTVDDSCGGFDPVAKRVREALLDEFSLRKRTIGRALYLAEIYRAVDGVPGVKTSLSAIADATFSIADPPVRVAGVQGDVRVVRARENQVVCIDAQQSVITITMGSPA